MNDLRIVQRRILDWRLVLAFCLLIAELVLVVGYINNAGEVAVKDRQQAVSNRQLAVRDTQINALIAEARAQAAEATQARAAAAASQRRQSVQLRQFTLRQNALLAYLRSIGVAVPTRFTSSSRSKATAPAHGKKAMPPKAQKAHGHRR
jgi:hypothetical protein